MPSRTIAIAGHLDLRTTLRPLHGRFARDGFWLAARTPQGHGSMRISRTTDELRGEAWGDGANWLLNRLGAVGGLEDDPTEFQTDHELVAELHRQHAGLRFGRTDLVFNTLAIAVCAQKVTGREASNAISGLYRVFSEPAPGPNSSLRLPPDPEEMAAAPYWAYHELHLEKRRADVLRRIAKDAKSIDDLREVSSSEAEQYLKGLPGVGEWSVAETLAVSHGDPDQVPVGDFHVKHIVVHHMTGKDRGTDAEMLELLEPFRPHRGRVARLLHTLGHEPKFGPRMTPRDITEM